MTSIISMLISIILYLLIGNGIKRKFENELGLSEQDYEGPNSESNYKEEIYEKQKEPAKTHVYLANSDNIGIEMELNRKCPICHQNIKYVDDAIFCPNCNTPHHKECWEANHGCAIYGCKKED